MGLATAFHLMWNTSTASVCPSWCIKGLSHPHHWWKCPILDLAQRLSRRISSLATRESVTAFISGMAPTMSSREIAELVGKEHAHVMRDIRAMMDVLSKNPDLDSCAISTAYVGRDGRQYPMYELDKDTCLTLLLGYDAVARMKVVKRWQELESQKRVPGTFAEALRLAAEQAERSERAGLKAHLCAEFLGRESTSIHTQCV